MVRQRWNKGLDDHSQWRNYHAFHNCQGLQGSRARLARPAPYAQRRSRRRRWSLSRRVALGLRLPSHCGMRKLTVRSNGFEPHLGNNCCGEQLNRKTVNR